MWVTGTRTGRGASTRAPVFVSDSYVGVLVSCDGDELRLGEGESLDSSWLAAVLRAVLVHLHHMEPGLVLMERLEDHHLDRGVQARGAKRERDKERNKKVRLISNTFGVARHTETVNSPSRFAENQNLWMIKYCLKGERGQYESSKKQFKRNWRKLRRLLPAPCCWRHLCCLSASVFQMIFLDASSAHRCLVSPCAYKPCSLKLKLKKKKKVIIN